jgi:hypothetical protein
MAASDPMDQPGTLIVWARSGVDGVEIEWPDCSRPVELSRTVQLFCQGIAELTTGGSPSLPEAHPHHHELPPPSPPRPQRIRNLALVVTEGVDHLGPREPTAEDRLRGARVEPRHLPRGESDPGPLLVQSLRLGSGLVGSSDPGLGEPVGPERPWSEFRAALLDEACRRLPPSA